MTITPTAAAGVLPAGAVDPAGANASAVPGDFLALVQQALAEALGTAPADPAVPEAEAETEGETTGDPLLAALAAGVAVGPAPVAVGAAGRAAPAGVPVAPGHANVAPGAGVADSGTSSDIRMSGDAGATTPAATTRTTPITPPATAPATAITPAAAAQAPDVAATPSAATGSAAATGPAAASADTSATALPPLAQEAPAAAPAPAATAGVGQPVPTVVTTPAGSGAPTVQHVTGQVFPEVTSLVSRGDGTHRITLTLNPEALGEVRVVMTVRDGAVHVRLAAGHEARQALVEGSPELTRLLELAGASESRIVVRDLPAGSASTGPGTAERGSEPGTQLGTGTGRSHDQHAGTRADNPATDGMNDGTTRHARTIRGTEGASQPRSNEPVTDTRSAGVDVTM